MSIPRTVPCAAAGARPAAAGRARCAAVAAASSVLPAPGEDKLVATSNVTNYRGYPLLAFLLVDPGRQGRGKGGAQLLGRSALALAAQGYSEWTLAVLDGNPARRLYERSGFAGVEIGTLPESNLPAGRAFASTLTITVDEDPDEPQRWLPPDSRRAAEHRLAILDALIRAAEHRGDVLGSSPKPMTSTPPATGSPRCSA